MRLFMGGWGFSLAKRDVGEDIVWRACIWLSSYLWRKMLTFISIMRDVLWKTFRQMSVHFLGYVEIVRSWW